MNNIVLSKDMLNEIEDMLIELEDVAHGEAGQIATRLRGKFERMMQDSAMRQFKSREDIYMDEVKKITDQFGEQSGRILFSDVIRKFSMNILTLMEAQYVGSNEDIK